MADRVLNVKITGDPRSLERALGRSTTSLQLFGRQVNTASRGLKGLALAPTFQVAGIAAATAAIGAGAKASIDFGRELRNVNSIAQLTEPQLKSLGEQIQQLSPEVGKGPAELARGLYDIVSSGFDAADAVQVLDASARAATAGLTETATATRAVSAILNAYHLSADQARKVSDLLFQEVNLGVNTFEDLANNLGDVVPQAAALKVPFEQIGAALATITLGGTGISEASTQLGRVLAQIVKPSKALAEQFKAMGFESGQAAVNTLGFSGIIEELSKRAGGNQKVLAEWLGDIRAIRGVINLTGGNLDTFNDKLREFGAATEGVGATQRAFAEQSKSAAFQLQRAKAAAEATATAVGSTLEPSIADVAGTLADALDVTTDLVTALKHLGEVKIPPIKVPLVGEFDGGSLGSELGKAFKFVLTRTGPLGAFNNAKDLAGRATGSGTSSLSKEVSALIAASTGATGGPRGRGNLADARAQAAKDLEETIKKTSLVKSLPNKLVQDLLDAQIQGSQDAVLDALKDQAAFLTTALNQKKLTRKDRTALKEQLVSVNDSIRSISESIKSDLASKAQALKDAAEERRKQAEEQARDFQNSLSEISAGLQLGQALAGLTSNTQDDLRNLRGQLVELLGNLSKATSDATRAAIVGEIGRVKDAIDEIKGQNSQIDRLSKVQEGRDAFRQLRDAKATLARQLRIGGEGGILNAREGLQDAQLRRQQLKLQGVSFTTPQRGQATVSGVNQSFGDVKITISSNQPPDAIAKAVEARLRQKKRTNTSQQRGRAPGGV